MPEEEVRFAMNLYSPRWGHEDRYEVVATRGDLTFRMGGSLARCDWDEKRGAHWSGYNDFAGNPLVNMLENDHICPPSVFVRAVEHAWQEWRIGNIDSPKFEREMCILADWVNNVTRHRPRSDFWDAIF